MLDVVLQFVLLKSGRRFVIGELINIQPVRASVVTINDTVLIVG